MAASLEVCSLLMLVYECLMIFRATAYCTIYTRADLCHIVGRSGSNSDSLLKVAKQGPKAANVKFWGVQGSVPLQQSTKVFGNLGILKSLPGGFQGQKWQ